MKRALIAVLVTGLGACEATEPEPGYGEGLGTPENPVPEDDAAYHVMSKIGATDTTIPTDVTSIVVTLRAFSQQPAHTLIGVAKTANDPAVAQLYSALSSSLASQLEGWIDTELNKVMLSGKPLRQVAGEVAGFTETALTKFGLDSTLTFTPTKTTHLLTGLAFRLGGYEIVVPVGGLAADSLTQHPALTIGTGGTMTLGDQKFGLGFGDHAWHGINLASKSAFGTDVTTAIEDTLDCGALAQTIAAKCYGGSCVGHPDLLDAICERSLDMIVTELAARVVAFDLDELRYVSGTAHMIDDNYDGLADRIENGVWDSEMNARRAPATFTALTR
jgi:hypothetical protein